MERIKPLTGRVLIKPIPVEMKTRGGIIIPDTSKEKPIRGEVVAVADKDKKGDPLTVVVGDIVLYGKYAGSEIELEGESYLISMETDILAILK